MCDICHRIHCPAGCPNADNPESAVRCDECGKKLFLGEPITKLKGFSFCEDCIIDNIRELEE